MHSAIATLPIAIAITAGSIVTLNVEMIEDVPPVP